ncbi:MAG: TadE/TadG family type IV pilus assembly protein [Methylorubrum rhodinum]|uniref:TadE/TadG family type IV pilus assembly protein n=1 Tax=Methylorubrum rhodinum TaxID=29428 RepID=UPI003BB1FCED
MGDGRFIAFAMRAISGSAPRRAPFGSDVHGVAVVEFSLVALPLFALIAVILEASLIVFAQHRLDVSTERAARLLRTGTFQAGATGDDPVARLRTAMCGGGFNMFRCADMRIDLTRTESFVPSQIAAPYDPKTFDWSAGFGARFDCPAGNSVVSLRVAVPVLRPFRFLDFTGQAMPGGRQLLTSTMVFRTEGFEDRSC